jgi:uncharacterized protein (DUF488 family)
MLNKYINPNQIIIYSIGYEGKTFLFFIDLLKQYDIKRIIDVRRSPTSNQQDYCQIHLQNNLLQHKITYLHFPDFSPPNEMRMLYQQTHDWEGFATTFKKFLSTKKTQIALWAKLLENGDCLLCYEKNHLKCHRSLLYPYIPYKILAL